MTTVLRLDPAYPTLWRGPSSLQFGIDPVAVVDDPTPWQQRLLTELDRGIPDTALLGLADAFGVPDDEVRDFVAALERVLLARDAVGADPMRGGRARRSRHPPRGPRGDPAVAAERGHGAARSPGGRAAAAGVPVLLVAQHIVEPRSAAGARCATTSRTCRWCSPAARRPSARTSSPASPPCLACAHAHRRDADPDWPMLAAQLIGRRVAPVPVVARRGGRGPRGSPHPRGRDRSRTSRSGR